MSKEMRSLILLVALPFGVAALLLAAGVAWRAAMPVPALAEGAGANGKDGFTVTTVDVAGGTQYLCMSSYAPLVGSNGEMRQFLTFYEIKPNGQGKAELFLVGSRCVDFDRGFAELGFQSAKGFGPMDLKKAQEKANLVGRKPAPGNPAPGNPAPGNPAPAPRNEAAPGNAPSND